MSVQLKRHYTLEEYFELERNSEERSEFFNGEVFCMSGVTPVTMPSRGISTLP